MAHADLPDAGRVSHFEIDAQLPAPNEKAALVGDPVPAGDANRYLTQNHAAGGFDGFANPSASVGLAVVNGVATTAMRSDGAPALDQGIIPMWTALHTYNAGLAVAAGQGIAMADETCWFGIGAALERINVNAAGYVSVMGASFGVGVLIPEALMHVQTTGAAVNFLILEGDRNNADTEIGILFKDRSAIGGGQEVARIWTDRDGVTGNFDLVFQAGDQGLAGLQSESIRIRGNTGFVGIGASVPVAQLHVDQPSGTGAIPVLMLDQGDVSEQHLVCSMNGADVDFPAIIELDVTGTPALAWNEAADEFTLNKGIQITGWVRHTSANYRRYYHLSVGGFDPGASGAAWTDPDANHTGGWRLSAVGHTLIAGTDIHADWDGVSDITVEIYFALNAAGNDGDTVDLRLVAYYNGVGDTATKTQTVEVATVTDGTQFKVYKAEFTIDYDAGGNVVDAGDNITFILNLETDTSEIDNIIVLHGGFYYNTTHLGIESGDV